MIIVTGGAGFIGRNLIRRLNKIQRTDILVVDNLRNGKKYKNLVGLHISDYIDKHCFIKRLLNNSNYLKNIEVIFHEGACSNTYEWNGRYLMNNNYQYSKSLLNYSVENSIPFIYASSASVYGKNIYSSNTFDNNENPLNIYGYSKFLFDQYVRSVLTKVSSQVCGLRYFNVYGPYENHKGAMASIIFNIYQKIIHRKIPVLFIGSRDFKRDFIYIDDVVNINIWMWVNKISGIFDCGTGVSESFTLLADIVLKFLNYDSIQYVPMPYKIRQHYQTFTKANISYLRNIGYDFSFIKLSEGIHRYLNWLIHNN
ncbi:ADP-L-Glycero-D-mannoheptose-6-epimerase [Candidatus Blochmanniella floridana]|uniref:ADP-L-glycero-D-manno-heptose-6-epimerase n=1 Tax=Blochmanniella floridana TaxID=203907 RepID=Q7U354_BLOFL|nr:ADP-L-Glycero-D-mannoheptose-6-epimerase [Candidatus Blochmannia floridanus]